ncbi:unnamed protein product [Fraxinus pennsylvanica]|uniref:Uncharacterized protein n=1 Tax=Fraxinus pennsylvanica TaxID=56036 RepID=A0AAD1ZRY4_9LAMI|nr:unnamed protein product [Fraxinus pennsylvanica]
MESHSSTTFAVVLCPLLAVLSMFFPHLDPPAHVFRVGFSVANEGAGLLAESGTGRRGSPLAYMSSDIRIIIAFSTYANQLAGAVIQGAAWTITGRKGISRRREVEGINHYKQRN